MTLPNNRSDRIRPFAWLRPPSRLLFALLIAAVLLFLFLKLWSEVSEGDTYHADAAILLALRLPGHPDVAIGPPWLSQAMLEISALGSATVLIASVLAVCGYLMVKRAWRRALLVAAATLSGSAVVLLLKDVIGRPRPAVVDHLAAVSSMSFPSGHAANSALVYLTVAALAYEVEPTVAARLYLLIVAMTLSLIIGLSRLYLGVHWPSDVAAGWALGAGWAIAWRAVAGQLLRR